MLARAHAPAEAERVRAQVLAELGRAGGGVEPPLGVEGLGVREVSWVAADGPVVMRGW